MMKWINIVLTVLSSANMVGDIIKGTSLENKAKNMYKRLDETEKLMLERVDAKMNGYIDYFSKEINSLKIVIKFLGRFFWKKKAVLICKSGMNIVW